MLLVVYCCTVGLHQLEPTPNCSPYQKRNHFPRNLNARSQNPHIDRELLAKAFVSLSIEFNFFFFLLFYYRLEKKKKKTYTDDDFIRHKMKRANEKITADLIRFARLQKKKEVDQMIMTPMSSKKRYLM